jgi:hypothetical protein
MDQEYAPGKHFILIKFDTDIFLLSFGPVGVHAAADILLTKLVLAKI